MSPVKGGTLYCAGFDLSQHVHRSAEEKFYHSRHWHDVMEMIQFGGLVVENPGLSQSQPAAAMEVERPNLVVIVDELAQCDLISRNHVPHDRRAYALPVTLKGQRLCRRAVRAVVAHEAALFQGIDPQTRAADVAALQLTQPRGG